MDDKLIIILDFEKIVTDISPETGLKVSDIDAYIDANRDRSDNPILIRLYQTDCHYERAGSLGQDL